MKSRTATVSSYLKALPLALSALTLTACDIGEGNKIESIRFLVTEQTVRLDNCNGDQLTAIAEFSDGSLVNITSRVNWTSGDASKLTISTVSGGGESSTLGVATPASGAFEGDVVNVTAEYFGLVTSIPLAITLSGSISEIGLNSPERTIAAGTNVQYSAWGRASDDTLLDISNLVTWTTDALDTELTLNFDDVSGSVAALTPTAAPRNITASYCSDTASAAKVVSEKLNVVADAPTSITLVANSDSLATQTIGQLVAFANYPNGGFQDRSLATRYSVTSANASNEPLLFSNFLGITSESRGNRTISATGGDFGVIEITAQYTDADGEDIAGVTGTTSITAVRATLKDDTDYLVTLPRNLLQGTNATLSITGQFNELDANLDVIGDYTQDITNLGSTRSTDVDATQLVISGSTVVAGAAGTNTFTAFTLLNSGFEQSVSVTTHDSEGASASNIVISSEDIGFNRYRLTATADISPTAGDTFNQDITLVTAWASADSASVHVSNASDGTAGIASGVASGCTTVTAHFLGASGTIDVDGDGASCTPPS